MTPNRWTMQIRIDLEHAQRMLLTYGEILPVFAVHTNDQMHVVGASAANDAERQAVYKLVKVMCMAHDAIALSHVAEAWIRRINQIPGESAKDHMKRAFAMRPEKAEDRQEIVVATLIYRGAAGNKVIHESREILRGPDGKPTGLGRKHVTPGKVIVLGNVTDILPEDRPTSQEMTVAKELLAMMMSAGIIKEGKPESH